MTEQEVKAVLNVFWTGRGAHRDRDGRVAQQQVLYFSVRGIVWMVSLFFICFFFDQRDNFSSWSLSTIINNSFACEPNDEWEMLLSFSFFLI